MSTRARIGIERADGSIKSIYSHFDGYPEGVGKTLKEHYTSPDKVEELVALGDISTLGEFYDEGLAKKRWKEQYNIEWLESEEGKKAREMTLPYKDRGEDGVEGRIDKNEMEFADKLGECCEDYGYLYKRDYDGVYKWFVGRPTTFSKPL